MMQYMKKYCGLTPDQQNRIMRLPSRWALISRQFPSYVLHETGGYFLELPPDKKAERKETKEGSSKGGAKRMFS